MAIERFAPIEIVAFYPDLVRFLVYQSAAYPLIAFLRLAPLGRGGFTFRNSSLWFCRCLGRSGGAS